MHVAPWQLVEPHEVLYRTRKWWLGSSPGTPFSTAAAYNGPYVLGVRARNLRPAGTRTGGRQGEC